MKMRLTVVEKAGGRDVSYRLRGIVLCGYTGRDQSAIRAHIEELKKEGVDPPPSVPMFYPKPFWGLTTDKDISVQGKETSGEVEYAVLVDGTKIFIGLGSDHTDRELERTDILKSKQVCPTVISGTLWPYDEIKDHWDRIEIRSWVEISGKKTLYQDSTFGTILPPEELIGMVQQRVEGSVDGIAIFSGTPPIVTGNMVFTNRFACEMLDPVLKREITFDYRIHTLDWFKA